MYHDFTPGQMYADWFWFNFSSIPLSVNVQYIALYNLFGCKVIVQCSAPFEIVTQRPFAGPMKFLKVLQQYVRGQRFDMFQPCLSTTASALQIALLTDAESLGLGSELHGELAYSQKAVLRSMESSVQGCRHTPITSTVAQLSESEVENADDDSGPSGTE